MTTATGRQLGMQIAEVMKIDHAKIKRLMIVCEPTEVATVHVEFLLSNEQADAITAAVKTFTLTE